MRRAYLLVLIALLVGCDLAGMVGPNPFAGCYDNSCVDTPQSVPGVPALKAISAGPSHTCGVTAAGEAWCWGDNTWGQLGDGTNAPRPGPVKVAGAISFTSISAGNSFTCGLSDDGTAHCWGIAQLGQAGATPIDSAPTVDAYACGPARAACARAPRAVMSGARAIDAGARHACAVSIAGEVFCWGYNSLGEIGSARFDTTYRTPRKVASAQLFNSVYTDDSFTCALTAAGKPWCWGRGDRGQLGDAVPLCTTVAGFPNFCSPTPVAVRDAATYAALSLSTSRVCGLAGTGVAHCWGDGNGPFGSPSNPARAEPIESGTTFSVVHDAGNAACATPVGKASVCWGVNTYGRLGIGERTEVVTRPTAIVGGRAFTTFTSGPLHVCALEANGAAWCWGFGGSGQLGSGPRSP